MSKPVCTIIGMGPGVSYAVAKIFGENGFGIALVARNLKKLTTLELQLKDEGVESYSFVADASDEDSLTSVFKTIKAEIGATDVLVYNAAVLKQGMPSMLNADELLQDFKVNVSGALISAQQVIPDMKEKKKGTIIFTGGGLALSPFPAYSSLAIGKAGIRSLAFSLGGELENSGIHVATVTICGLVKSGTRFDPRLIAEEYWKIYNGQGTRQREIVFQ